MFQAPDSIQTFLDTLHRLNPPGILDILLIATMIYGVLYWLKGTSGMSLVKGAAFFVIAGLLLSSLLKLTVVTWLLRNSVPALLIVVPVVFQPELRRALERVGRSRVTSRRGRRSSESVLSIVAEAAMQLSARRLGALIVIERATGLDDYIRSGTVVDSVPSVSLLVNLFWRNSPLHDGAVVVRENRVVAAGCTLPLSEEPLPAHMGTRHRAAYGLSERTDALVIVVSEETGTVSIAVDGGFSGVLDDDQLRTAFRALTAPVEGALAWSPLHRSNGAAATHDRVADTGEDGNVILLNRRRSGTAPRPPLQ